MRGALGSTSNQWHMIVDGHSTYFVRKFDDGDRLRPIPAQKCMHTNGCGAPPLNGDMQHSMSRMSLP